MNWQFFLEVLVGGLLAGVMYSLVALGFVLIYKASGVFNFAQGAMVLFAALTMARFAQWIPQWTGLSGKLTAKYTAASLVSESKGLAHPASVDSIPSSAGQEDHVSMGMIAARHVREVVRNAEIVVAFEALAAAQALDLRERMAGAEPAPGTAAARAAIREVIAFVDTDRGLKADIDAAVELIESRAIVEAVEAAVGPLD